tara:strand:+ start:13744 stop:13941 length:198 start_codon:yes stop_codon:yes gene_type:complete
MKKRPTIREAILDKTRYYDAPIIRSSGFYGVWWSGKFHSNDDTKELVDEVIREHHPLSDPDSDDW